MMSKKRNPGMSVIRMVLVIPAALLLTLLFMVSTNDQALATQNGLSFHTAPAPVLQEEPIFTVVEQMPEFPGGQEALIKYMVNNVKYPENARKKGIQGTVFVSFVVGKDGSISNVKVLRGVDKELDEEAIRVVSNMPKWKPGKEKGKAVKVQYNLPVAYKLDGGDENKAPEKGSTPERFLDVKKGDK